MRCGTLSLLLVAALAPGAAGAGGGAKPATYEVGWRRGGFSAPYELAAFEHPSGPAIFVGGYTGGVAAVGRRGVLWRWATGNTQVASIATGDLTGDGIADLVAALYDGRRLVALDGVDGSSLATRSFPTVPEGIAVADADGDGAGDVYVVTQGFSDHANTVHLLTGPQLRPTWSASVGSPQGSVLGIDAQDVTGDGRADIGFGTTSNTPRVYLFDASGAKRWEADLGGTVTNVAIADGGRTIFATRGGGLLAALDATTGASRWSLPSALAASRLALGDLDGDGEDDAAWSVFGPSGKSPTFQVVAVSGATGKPLWWQTTVTPAKAIVVGDFDGDADPDVAVSTQDAGSGTEVVNSVIAYEGGTGRPLWTHPFAGEQTTFLSDVVLADMAGDSRPEVIVAPYWEVLHGLDGAAGGATWTSALGSGVTSAAVADLDGDGAPEVIHGDRDFRVSARDAATGTVRWTRDLGGDVVHVSPLPHDGGHDVLAIGQSTLYRLRGRDGAARWSLPLQGMGTEIERITATSGEVFLAVGARARRMQLGQPGNSLLGYLNLVDAATGRLHWTVPSPGVPWYLDVADLNGDGARDLAVGMTNANLGVAVYDGAALASAPVALWRSATDGVPTSLTVIGRDVVTSRGSVNAVVAQDGATGQERWRRELGSTTRLVGVDDVNDDGTADMLVATQLFADRIAAVSGADGTVVFDIAAGIRFVTAARSTDLSGDGLADLLFTSDGGTYGDGGVFALDGRTLTGPTPQRLWSYPDVNATALLPVSLERGEHWLAYGFTVRPDALTLLRPIPEEPDPADD